VKRDAPLMVVIIAIGITDAGRPWTSARIVVSHPIFPSA
jgi:hypothetical protein